VDLWPKRQIPADPALLYEAYGFTDPDSINQENAKENQHELSGAVQTETGQCGGRSCRCEIR